MPAPAEAASEPAAGAKATALDDPTQIHFTLRPSRAASSPCRQSISSRRYTGQAAEHRGEVTRGPKSYQPRDLRDGQLRPGQPGAGLRDTLPDHESMRRHAGAVFEEPRVRDH
jgi:hypothetical protein